MYWSELFTKPLTKLVYLEMIAHYFARVCTRGEQVTEEAALASFSSWSCQPFHRNY
jgi:hypothetical protein